LVDKNPVYGIDHVQCQKQVLVAQKKTFRLFMNSSNTWKNYKNCNLSHTQSEENVFSGDGLTSANFKNILFMKNNKKSDPKDSYETNVLNQI
jgi:hypothetical protein